LEYIRRSKLSDHQVELLSNQVQDDVVAELGIDLGENIQVDAYFQQESQAETQAGIQDQVVMQQQLEEGQEHGETQGRDGQHAVENLRSSASSTN
jgi:hypothetical protein